MESAFFVRWIYVEKFSDDCVISLHGMTLHSSAFQRGRIRLCLHRVNSPLKLRGYFEQIFIRSGANGSDCACIVRIRL